MIINFEEGPIFKRMSERKKSKTKNINKFLIEISLLFSLLEEHYLLKYEIQNFDY